MQEEQRERKNIRIKFLYLENSSSVILDVVPSDNSLGNAICDPARCTNVVPSVITAYPKTEREASVARMQMKIGTGEWKDINYNDNQVKIFSEDNASIIYVKVTFGVQGELIYDLAGGTPTIPTKPYVTGGVVDISSVLPTKSGYVFVGWSKSSNGPLFCQPSEKVVFEETSTTLYAIWYKTPQSITNFKHWNSSTNSEYTGDYATVSAQVAGISRTSTPGILSGTLTWTVTMPDTHGEEYPKFSKLTVGSEEDTKDIIETTDQTNTSGVEVKFSYTQQVEDDWWMTIFYLTGDLQAIYHPNGGVGGPPDQNFLKGIPFRISTEIPLREGYVFVGWAYNDAYVSPTSPDVIQPGTMYGEPDSGYEFTLLDNILFYAVWADGITITVVHHNITTGHDSEIPLSISRVWVDVYNKRFGWSISDVKEGYRITLSPTIKVTDESGVNVGEGSGETGYFEYHNTDEYPSGEWTATIYYIEEKVYTITYYTLGGTPEIAPQKVSPDENGYVTLSTIRPRKKGYTFLGWATRADAEEAEYKYGEKIQISSDMYLYAIYQKIKYRVTLIPEMGYGGTGSVEVAYGDPMPEAIMPTYTLRTFIGYYLLQGGEGTKYYNHDGSSAHNWDIEGDRNIYAYFAYALLFDANGGVGGPEIHSSDVEGEEFVIPRDVPTKSGHVFAGWAFNEIDTEAPYDNLFKPGETFVENWKNGDRLIAVWRQGIPIKVVYLNTFNSVRQEKPDAHIYATAWEITTIPEGQEEDWDIGHFELSYISNAQFIQAEFFDENGETAWVTRDRIASTLFEGFENYESWICVVSYYQEAYTINYHAQGGTPEPKTQSIDVNHATGIHLSPITPEKEGFKFLGWSTSAVSQTVEYYPDEIVSLPDIISDPAVPLELYAVYEEEGSDSEGSDQSSSDVYEYTVYGQPDDPVHGSVSPSQVSYFEGDMVVFTASASTGYKFAYWMNMSGGGALTTDKTLSFYGTPELDGNTFIAVFIPIKEKLPTDLIYYVPTGLLMSYHQTLIWNDDGLKGCGDGSDAEP